MLGGISIWQLLIVLAILILIFGTKKLKNLGGDLGGAVKGFKEAVNKDEDDKNAQAKAIDGESKKDDKSA
ncbi:MAG: Sec-independent protein translocase subunit TatA [Marinomonas sp.]|jgi:sec-independent protein translocase protein TatA|uniref:Sec-independent protein translocase subunit TatA n=1 Tax=unclassified Marinomonas TaxID=196814 RepID=UPI0005FA788A|nr:MULTISPECIES: Sec-independent protein translocase subunit TatA [unclassified Marinomonas]KJZ15913.1 preprotein translocase subunit TatA [Marinomonas sp. S3726]KZM43169.1 preprotein translocase subunit TatA [Marinomonas sp. SBI22]KZM44740.1 preprotein translocase subunit TatA [Marinomonas sp. SBI8L]